VTSRSLVVFMLTVVIFAACLLINWEGRKIAPAPAAGKVKHTVPAAAVVRK